MQSTTSNDASKGSKNCRSFLPTLHALLLPITSSFYSPYLTRESTKLAETIHYIQSEWVSNKLGLCMNYSFTLLNPSFQSLTYIAEIHTYNDYNRIALWDISSTSLNYTGASLSGPTIFAIIYSSVTIWTAGE